MRPLRPFVLAAVALSLNLSLSGCLAAAAVGAAGAVVGTAAGVTAKGVGMAAGAAIPGGGEEDR